MALLLFFVGLWGGSCFLKSVFLEMRKVMCFFGEKCNYLKFIVSDEFSAIRIEKNVTMIQKYMTKMIYNAM